MLNFLKKKATVREAGLGLVPFCKVPGDFPQEEISSFAEPPSVVLLEIFFLKVFAIQFAVYCSHWSHEHKMAIGREFTMALPIGVPDCIPQSLLKDSSLEELIAKAEERSFQYMEASKEPHENGPAWQVAKVFVELCNKGDSLGHLGGLMAGTLVQAELIERVVESSKKIKISE